MTRVAKNETSGRAWVAVQSIIMLAVLIAGPLGREAWNGHWHWLLGGPLLLLGAWTGLRGKADLGGHRTPHPEPRPDGELVTGGIYSRMRHPLYASLMLLGFAWAALWNSSPALGLAVVQALFLDAKAREEERRMQRRFSDYDAYSRRVKRFVPGIY